MAQSSAIAGNTPWAKPGAVLEEVAVGTGVVEEVAVGAGVVEEVAVGAGVVEEVVIDAGLAEDTHVLLEEALVAVEYVPAPQSTQAFAG